MFISTQPFAFEQNERDPNERKKREINIHMGRGVNIYCISPEGREVGGLGL